LCSGGTSQPPQWISRDHAVRWLSAPSSGGCSAVSMSYACLIICWMISAAGQCFELPPPLRRPGRPSTPTMPPRFEDAGFTIREQHRVHRPSWTRFFTDVLPLGRSPRLRLTTRRDGSERTLVDRIAAAATKQPTGSRRTPSLDRS
jgi:hypothetical protein